MTGIYLDKPNLSFYVSELHSDKANLLSRVTRITSDMPPIFDWKQVLLSDLSSVRNSSCWEMICVTLSPNSTHNQTVRALAWLQGRVSFYFCSKTKSGLDYRRSSFAEIDKRTELDCENRPLYTQVHWKVPKKIMWFMSRTGCYIITSSRLNHATSHGVIMSPLSVKVNLSISSSSCWRKHFHHVVHFWLVSLFHLKSLQLCFCCFRLEIHFSC